MKSLLIVVSVVNKKLKKILNVIPDEDDFHQGSGNFCSNKSFVNVIFSNQV